MRKIITVFVLLIISGRNFASDIDSLRSYLAAHQVIITRQANGELQQDEATKKLFSSAMQGKSLFVFGEGGSHFLHLNGDLWLMLLNHFNATGKLKYTFIEGDRSLTYLDNLYLNGQYTFRDTDYKAHVVFMEKEKTTASQGHMHRLVGIDFERPWNFRAALDEILAHVDKDNRGKLFDLAPYTRDSDYLKFRAKEWQPYYRKIGEAFYRDSALLKPLLKDQFEIFKYLVTNPNNSTPTGERNGPMAENLLAEIGRPRAGDIYLLDCGMAHSRPNIKGTLVNILSRSDILKDKVTVMNVACIDCTTSVEPVSNWAFPFMKKDILDAFRTAAKADIVIYDLRDIPATYRYIRDYGDLMVFAQRQH